MNTRALRHMVKSPILSGSARRALCHSHHRHRVPLAPTVQRCRAYGGGHRFGASHPGHARADPDRDGRACSVDLSVGPLLGFVNVTLIAWLSAAAVTHPLLFFGWALGLACAWQLLQALVVIHVRVAPIIVSLSGYLALSGTNLLVMSRPGGLAPEWMMAWGGGSQSGVLPPVLWIVIAALAFWVLVRQTGFFVQLRLVGCDERMAFTSGIRTDRVRVFAHVLGGVFMGLAAICHTALISSGDPTQGATYTLQAVTALVLGGASLAGGRGSAAGAVLGALNMFLITYILGTFDFGALSGFVTRLSFGSILIASLLISVLISGRQR